MRKRISDKIIFEMAMHLKYFLLKDDDEALLAVIALLREHIVDVVTLRRFSRALDPLLNEYDTTLSKDESLTILCVFEGCFTKMLANFSEFESLLLDLHPSTHKLLLKMLGAKLSQLVPSLKELVQLCDLLSPSEHPGLVVALKDQWIGQVSTIQQLTLLINSVGKLGCQYVLESLGYAQLRKLAHDPVTLKELLDATECNPDGQVLILAALGREHLKPVLSLHGFLQVFGKDLSLTAFRVPLLRAYIAIREGEPDLVVDSPSKLVKDLQPDRCEKIRAADAMLQACQYENKSKDDKGGWVKVQKKPVLLPPECYQGFLGLIHRSTSSSRPASPKIRFGR